MCLPSLTSFSFGIGLGNSGYIRDPVIDVGFKCSCVDLKRSLKSVKDVHLQHVSEVIIIVPNHRHRWAQEHNGQSDVFKYLLNSA